MAMARIDYYLPCDYPAVQRNMVEAEVYYEVRDSAENLNSMVAANPRSVLIALEGGDIVGSLLSSPLGVSISCIWGLAVAEKYRRRGIATMLLGAVEECLRDQGVKEIWPFVEVENVASQALFEKAGYTFNRDHRYYGPWKALDSGST